MKLVSGMVRPDRVDAIKAALGHLDIVAISVTQVLDHAPQDHGTIVWRAHEYQSVSSLKRWRFRRGRG